MNINEYVKGKRFNDLSTDVYDWTKWCAENNAELERRIQAAGLENCERNGRILVEYALENNILVSMDNLFGVLTDARYNGRFVRLPPPPVVPKPRPTVASLGYTRRKLAQMIPAEMKALLRNETIGTYDEVQAQVDQILRQPAESTPTGYQGSAAERLHQLGYQQDERPSHVQQAPAEPTDAERKTLNLLLAQKRWDAEKLRIEALVIQGYQGKIDYAKTQSAQREALIKLGKRP